MNELNGDKTVRSILTILRWAWETKGQKEALEESLVNWLFANDDGVKTVDVLAEEYLKAHDIDEVVGKAEKGKIARVQASLFEGTYYVNVTRNNGAEHQYKFRGLATIQRQILQVAIMQDRLAEYAYQDMSVRYIDLDDIARMWATGPRWQLSLIEHNAHQKFEEYVEAKNKAESPLPCKVEDFRVEISEVDDEN